MSKNEEVFCEAFEKDLLVYNYMLLKSHTQQISYVGSKSNSQAVPCSHVEVVLYMIEGKSMEIDDCFLCRVVFRNRQV